MKPQISGERKKSRSKCVFNNEQSYTFDISNSKRLRKGKNYKWFVKDTNHGISTKNYECQKKSA
jgi:hypothetical protein